MITITPRGIARALVALSLAGLAMIAAFWAVTGRISCREALAGFIAVVVGAAAGAWLRERKTRGSQGERS